MEQDGVEIIADKAQSKYVIRSTVLSEEDLTSISSTEVSDMEGLRSTLQISDLRGIDTANVSFILRSLLELIIINMQSIFQYTCRAKNEHGWDELTHILEVVGKLFPIIIISSLAKREKRLSFNT